MVSPAINEADHEARVLARAKEFGLGKMLEIDRESVIAAAQRAKVFSSGITLDQGKWGTPWPPMQVAR